MLSYHGIYYQEGKQERPATVELYKNRLHISIQNQYGQPLSVYWDYDKILKQDFRQGNRTVVKYIGVPVQVIEIIQADFAPELLNRMDASENSFVRRMFGARSLGMLKLLAGLIFVGSLLYFFLIPFMSERMAMRVPVSFEKNLGDGMYDAMKSSFRTDDQKSLLVNDFFSALNLPSEYDIRITVVKENTDNAFALPGGHMVVYDKMLQDLDSYEELAALLAHEYTHISQRHATRSVFRQLGSSIFIAILLGNRNAVLNMAVSEADNLKTLSYSRKLEKEADLNGLRILEERQINGNGFVALFELLQKEENTSGEKLPVEWISDHPDLRNRINYIKKDPHFNAQGVKENEILKELFNKMKEAS